MTRKMIDRVREPVPVMRREEQTIKLSKAKHRLMSDATEAGYEISHSDGQMMIVKRHARTGRIIQGLVLYPCGTAYDATVRLDCAKGLRSHADMRSVLGLTERKG